MVVYSNIIPFKGFLCINICGILFVRKDLASKMSYEDYNHEAIHTEQIKELLVVGFYAIYILEWLWRVLFTKDRFSHKAYRNISFEREAYANEGNDWYLNIRQPFAMWR